MIPDDELEKLAEHAGDETDNLAAEGDEQAWFKTGVQVGFKDGYRAAEARRAERVKQLEWQVSNWERKETLEATCCMENERAAKLMAERVFQAECKESMAAEDCVAALKRNAKLVSALQEAASMLETVSKCRTHECEDCREYSVIHAGAAREALAEKGENL